MISTPHLNDRSRDWLHVPLRHKRIVAGVFFFVIAVAAVLTFLLPRTYRSEGKLLVRLGRENVAIDPTTSVGAATMFTIQQSRENEMNSLIEIVKSRALAEKVVDAVGAGKILGTSEESADRDEAIRQVVRALDVEAVRKSNVLRIVYDARSAALAQSVVDSTIASFLEEHIRLNRTPGAREFLEAQTANIRHGLEAREDELRGLKNETGLAAAEGRRTILVNRIGRLEDDMLQTEAALDAAQAKVKRLDQEVNGIPATQVVEQTVGFANEAADGMRQQLYALEIREQELAAKVTDVHPMLQQVRQQITDAQQVYSKQQPDRTQTKTGVTKTHEETKLLLLKEEPEVAYLKAKYQRLAAQLKSEQESLAKFNSDELRVARLQREVQLEDANYRKYVDSLEQAQIDQAMAAEGKSNISIVQPASLERKAVWPRPGMSMALAAVLGLLGGIGLAFVYESHCDKIRTAEQFQAETGLPVLANIPRFGGRQLVPVNGGDRP